MGLRGPHARPLSRPQPAAKPRVTYRLTCWECRKAFAATRIDAQFCSNGCKQTGYRRRKLSKQI